MLKTVVNFMGKVRMEDLRQMERKIEDKKRALKLLESKMESRRVALDKRNTYLQQSEKRAQDLIKRKEELQAHEAEVSLREAAIEAVARKEKIVAAEELQITEAMVAIQAAMKNLNNCQSRYKQRCSAANRELVMRESCLIQLRGFVSDLSAKLESKRIAFQASLESPNTGPEPPMSQVSAIDYSNNVKACLGKRAHVLAKKTKRLKEQEVLWQEKDRDLKDKQTHIEKMKRELKWVEESYQLRRSQLKSTQANCFKEDLHLARVQADVEKSGLDLEKKKIAIELAMVAFNQQAAELEEGARQIATDVEKFTKISAEQHKEMTRLGEEHRDAVRIVENLAAENTKTVKQQRELLEWANAIKEKQEEVTALQTSVASTNYDIKSKLQELLWREAEITGHFRETTGKINPEPTTVSNEAVDAVPSLLTHHLHRTTAVYCAKADTVSLKKRRKPVERERFVKNPELRELTAQFYRAMGRLFGAGHEPPEMTPTHIRIVQRTLARERELKQHNKILQSLQFCPFTTGKDCTLSGVTLWWRSLVPLVMQRSVNVLGERKALLNDAVRILTKSLRRKQQKTTACVSTRDYPYPTQLTQQKRPVTAPKLLILPSSKVSALSLKRPRTTDTIRGKRGNGVCLPSFETGYLPM